MKNMTIIKHSSLDQVGALLLGSLVFSCLFFLWPAPAQAINCSLIRPGTVIPSGFGAPYNAVSVSPVKEMLVDADCTANGATITVGNGSQLAYAYKLMYEWTGAAWVPHQLTGQNITPDWIVAQGSITLPKTPAQLAENNFVVGYTCVWVNNEWKCGCRDAACAQPQWQVQAYQQAQIVVPPGGGSSSSGGSSSGGSADWSKTITGVGVGDSHAKWASGDYEGAVGPQPNQNLYANVTGNRTTVTSLGALQSAFNNANPGDAVVLKNGNYSGGITLSGGGSKDKPVFILAESLHGVTWNSPKFNIGGNAHDIHIEGFSFNGGGKVFEMKGGAKEIHIIQNKFNGGSRLADIEWEVDDVEIAHNEVSGTNGVTFLIRTAPEGTGKQAPKRLYFHNNYIHDISRNQSNGGEVLHLGFGRYTAPDREFESLIEYNHFEKTDGDDEIIGFKSHKNHVRRNLFKGSNSHVSIRLGNENVVEENIILGGRYNIGIRVIGVENRVLNNYIDLANGGGSAIVFFHRSYWSCCSDNQINYDHSRNNVIENNTFVGGSKILRIFNAGNTRDEARDNTIKNNIFLFDNGGNLFQDDTGQHSRAEMISKNNWENNILWTKSGGAASSIGGNNKSVDPGLQTQNGLRYPTATSPAVNASIGSSLKVDLFGKSRDAQPDIGALEV